jgi:hypothetical protein
MIAIKASDNIIHHPQGYSGYQANCPVCDKLNTHDFLVSYNEAKQYPQGENYSEAKDYCQHLYKIQWDGMHDYWFYFVPAA